MFNFFKKINSNNSSNDNQTKVDFNIELIACILAYEVARADGSIQFEELNKIKSEVTAKSLDLNLNPEEVFESIVVHSDESTSFNNFINEINENFSYEQKLELIRFLWQTAYADNVLDVDEERLVRRIADMIRIKDIQVLKLKDQARQRS